MLAESLAKDAIHGQHNNEYIDNPMLQALFLAQEEEIVYILPENEEIFEHFCNLLSQFTYTPNGYLSGLNYTNVYSYLKLKVPFARHRKAIFEGITICERVFIKEFNSQQKAMVDRKLSHD